jgi:hypothetical protein
VFETAEEAARAYDETAMKIDNERACLNLSGEYDYVGQHVKDELYPLSGEDGISVIGVQAGVASAVRLRLKFYSCHCNYLEMHLDKATSLPKMDAGVCDIAYCPARTGCCAPNVNLLCFPLASIDHADASQDWARATPTAF